MLRITSYCKTAISTYLSPLANQLAFNFEGQMILETFLTEKPPVACSTIPFLIFRTGC